MKNIASYEDILNNYDSMCEVIIEELDGIKKEYSTKRRTVIENTEEAVYEEKEDGRDRGLLPYGPTSAICALLIRMLMRETKRLPMQRINLFYLYEYRQDLHFHRYGTHAFHQSGRHSAGALP